MKDRSHDKAMVELFLAYPSYPAELLVKSVEDGSTDEPLQLGEAAIGNVCRVRG